MAGTWLADRSAEAEWMDDAAQTEPAFRAALKDLEFLNRITFGYRPTLNWLDAVVARTRATSLSVLDVGAGGGDMLRRIAQWGAARGVTLELTGLDRSPAARAAAQHMGPPGNWLTIDVFDLAPDVRFDIVISALFTHHLQDGEVVRFLQWMAAHARHGWMINDIHRHAIPWCALWAGTRLLRLDPMVVHDSTVSVARAFTRSDWRRLVLEAEVAARVEWHLPFRWSVSSERPR